MRAGRWPALIALDERPVPPVCADGNGWIAKAAADRFPDLGGQIVAEDEKAASLAGTVSGR
jgi:hypothetical protein